MEEHVGGTTSAGIDGVGARGTGGIAFETMGSGGVVTYRTGIYTCLCAGGAVEEYYFRGIASKT